MLLQVHDELLFEVPEVELDQVAEMVKQEMERVHKLDVPLIADVHSGLNWRDLKG
ncbi:MAG: DNA polymerase [Bryobacterales bacterium]